MSTDISSVKILKLDAWMYAADIVRLTDDYEGNLPESDFVTDHFKAAYRALAGARAASNAQVKLISFTWSGGGRCYDDLVEHIAPRVHGKVEVIFM